MRGRGREGAAGWAARGGRSSGGRSSPSASGSRGMPSNGRPPGSSRGTPNTSRGGRGPFPSPGGGRWGTPTSGRGGHSPYSNGRFGSPAGRFGSSAAGRAGASPLATTAAAAAATSGGRRGGWQPDQSSGAGGAGYRAGGNPNYREAHASAKLFGSGPTQVQFERDKEPCIWKVSPPPGQRFSPAFLQGVSNFVAFQLSKQHAQQGRQRPQQAMRAGVTLNPQPVAPGAPLGPPGAGHGRAAVAAPTFPVGTAVGAPAEPAVPSKAAVPAAAGSPGGGTAAARCLSDRGLGASLAAASNHQREDGVPGAEAAVGEELVAASTCNSADGWGLPHAGSGWEEGATEPGSDTLASVEGRGPEQGSPTKARPAVAAVDTSGSPGTSGNGGDVARQLVQVELVIQACIEAGQCLLGAAARLAPADIGAPRVGLELTFLPESTAAAAAAAESRSLSPPARPVDHAQQQQEQQAGQGKGEASWQDAQQEQEQEQGQPAQEDSAGIGEEQTPAGEEGNTEVLTDIGEEQFLEEEEEQSPEGEEEEGNTEVSCEGGRGWWPPHSLAQVPTSSLPVAAVDGTPAATGSVQLSLRLERMGLTDREAAMLAGWHAQQAQQGGGRAIIRKLWLFDNQLGDEGARQVARMLHPGMLELHLSHNRITVEGAAALLAAVEAGQHPPGKPLWLRLEWNRVSLETLVKVLEREHAERGLVVDLPQPLRSDAAPSLPSLPAYLTPSPGAPRVAGACTAAEPEASSDEEGSDSPVLSDPKGTEGSSARDLCGSPATGMRQLAGRGQTPQQQQQQQQQQPQRMGPRGPRNALKFLVEVCHARLPWLSCQYQLPAEAAVLRAARSSWSTAGAAGTASQPPSGYEAEVALQSIPSAVPTLEQQAVTAAAASDEIQAEEGSGEPAMPGRGAVRQPPPPPQQQRGPLLLFPDTSAMLSMLGASASVAQRTSVSFKALADLAGAGMFGRTLDPQEQVFLVVADSVAKQLDGLKADPACRVAIRHFMGQGLDAWGPAGLDFLTVLATHEGEGLVVEHEAQVAGSRSRELGSVGQKMDHKIVEVALFFQQEILQAAAAGAAEAGGETTGELGSGGSAVRRGAFPVLLLSGDVAQVQMAKSHGLPAVRLAELAPLEGWLAKHGQQQPQRTQQAQQALSASLARELLGPSATTGLGAVALRSIHTEFDGAVACLRAATDALHAAHAALSAVHTVSDDPGATMDPAAALAKIQAVLAAGHAVSERNEGTDLDPDNSTSTRKDTPLEEEHNPSGSPSVAALGVLPGTQREPHWLQQAGQLVAAVQHKLGEWEGLVQSHQSPHRVLRWAGA